MKLRGYLFILAAAALWGVIGPLSKLVFAQGVHPLEVAFWRAVLTWMFFGLHAAATRRVRIAPRHIPTVCLFGLTGVTGFYGSYQLAIQGGGAALASVLLYTAPAWVAVMARIFFKETMTSAKLAALVLTLAGVAGISWGGGAAGPEAALSVHPSAVLFGLASGFCYALYYIFGKYFSGRYTSPNLFLYILPIGALGLYPFVPFSPKNPTAWMALITLSFMSTYGAYYFYYLSLQHLDATRASITATLEPVIAAGVAYLWWNEYFSVLGYAGSLMILGSVILMVIEGSRDTDGDSDNKSRPAD